MSRGNTSRGRAVRIQGPRESVRPTVHAHEVVLDMRPPFDPAVAFAFLRARAIAGSETFAGSTYCRGVAMDGARGVVSITPDPDNDAVLVNVSPSLSPLLMSIAARTQRLFDSEADLAVIGKHLARDADLGERVAARPALRVMGAFDPFEWAIRAVLGQQISVRGAMTIAGRLVAKLGFPLKSAGDPIYPSLAWPDAARMADASEESIRSLGLTRARARTVRVLARAVADGTLRLDRSADPATTREALLALP